RWQGTVIGANGIPVAGARIDVVPVDVDVVSVIPAATDAEGKFSALVPAKAQLVDVRVAPPGFAWSTFRRPVTPEPLTIIVDSRGSTLVIDFDRGKDDLQPFIWHSGSAFGAFSLLSGWSAQLDTTDAQKNHMRLRIPLIEPGDYTVFMRSAADFDFRTSTPAGKCSPVVLAPHGETSMTL